MSHPLIITAALNGAEVQRRDCPALPLLPEEVAAEARRASQAGASIVHIHGRRADGSPTQDRETFRSFIAAIRSESDVLVQFSTGGAVGMSPAERIEALDLKPDIATLTLGSVNFGQEVFLNPLPLVESFLDRLNQLQIPVELEVFDSGMLATASHLLRLDRFQIPYYYDFVMGVPGGISASVANILHLRDQLPTARPWSVAAIGRHQLPMAAAAVVLGGHVRVGLEDNIYYRKGELATGNAQFVERIVRIAGELDRPIATVAQTREILGLV